MIETERKIETFQTKTQKKNRQNTQTPDISICYVWPHSV